MQASLEHTLKELRAREARLISLIESTDDVAYLSALCRQIQEEHTSMLQEMRALSDSVDHIKSVVSMQHRARLRRGAAHPR